MLKGPDTPHGNDDLPDQVIHTQLQFLILNWFSRVSQSYY